MNCGKLVLVEVRDTSVELLCESVFEAAADGTEYFEWTIQLPVVSRQMKCRLMSTMSSRLQVVAGTALFPCLRFYLLGIAGRRCD